MLFRKWIEKWRSYKYRFVPWIALNLRNRTVREVGSIDQDKTVPDSKVTESLSTFLHALHIAETQSPNNLYQSETMYNTLGYEIKRLESNIPGAGKGVFVTKGDIPVGNLVALYPGQVPKGIKSAHIFHVIPLGSQVILKIHWLWDNMSITGQRTSQLTWHTKNWISLCKVLHQSFGNIFQMFGTVVVILPVKTHFLELLH